MIGKDEKKVEYLELIYDLIFVYVIGKNNSLLHNFDNGFVAPANFVAYALCTLAIIQIWNFTTFYINLFGRNSFRDHVFLCINMYLMYFIGESTRTDWTGYQAEYHIAWGLILINIGIQYMIELRNHKMDVWNRGMIKKMAATLFVEAAVVLISANFNPDASAIASFVAIFTGIIMTFYGRVKSASQTIDFSHLTERAMLYVVFTFGEMIIGLAGYFSGDGSFELNTIYYSLMAFLIVVGLFLSYGTIYDHIIDREREDSGMFFMMIHIFIIFALNNITNSLEFMREEEVAILPKVLFIVLSIVGYYVFLLSTRLYAKRRCAINKAVMTRMLLLTAVFVAVMIVIRSVMAVNIFVSVVYVFLIYREVYIAGKKTSECES